MNKIDMMYRLYGRKPLYCCGQCDNCKKVNKGNHQVYKCLAYGNTNSAASDWKISHVACGNFGKPVPEVPAIELVRHRKKDKSGGQVDGQMTIQEVMG